MWMSHDFTKRYNPNPVNSHQQCMTTVLFQQQLEWPAVMSFSSEISKWVREEQGTLHMAMAAGGKGTSVA
jgi:hypothetical protein